SSTTPPSGTTPSSGSSPAPSTTDVAGSSGSAEVAAKPPHGGGHRPPRPPKPPKTPTQTPPPQGSGSDDFTNSPHQIQQRRVVTWEQLCKLARELPEVTVDVWYNTPALKVRGKGFVRLKEDGASVVFMTESVDEQEFLIEAQPDLYFITDHYRGWPAVLA